MMDLKPFKLDIDELLVEFAECGSITLAGFKRVWLAKKFSFVFEASPSTNHGFFMQSLYAHSIGYMVSAGSLSNRLGGLYCLYCLYETQPFKPPFKVYLSLGELRELKSLEIDAKIWSVKGVSVLLKSMLERNMFLFGFVGVNESFAATQRVDELTEIQNARVQTAYNKLFANSRLEHFIHMDLGMELEVDLLKKRSSDYAVAKEIAVKGASQVTDVQDIEHIIIREEDERLIGEVVEKTAADWNSQKELFYQQTGIDRLSVSTAPSDDNENSSKEQEDHNNFSNELLALLEEM